MFVPVGLSSFLRHRWQVFLGVEIYFWPRQLAAGVTVGDSNFNAEHARKFLQFAKSFVKSTLPILSIKVTSANDRKNLICEVLIFLGKVTNLHLHFDRLLKLF